MKQEKKVIKKIWDKKDENNINKDENNIYLLSLNSFRDNNNTDKNEIEENSNLKRVVIGIKNLIEIIWLKIICN